jgi:hypothetical protein
MCQRLGGRVQSMRDQHAAARAARVKKIFGSPREGEGSGSGRPFAHRDDAYSMQSMHPINGVDRT